MNQTCQPPAKKEAPPNAKHAKTQTADKEYETPDAPTEATKNVKDAATLTAKKE